MPGRKDPGHCVGLRTSFAYRLSSDDIQGTRRRCIRAEAPSLLARNRTFLTGGRTRSLFSPKTLLGWSNTQIGAEQAGIRAEGGSIWAFARRIGRGPRRPSGASRFPKGTKPCPGRKSRQSPWICCILPDRIGSRRPGKGVSWKVTPMGTSWGGASTRARWI